MATPATRAANAAIASLATIGGGSAPIPTSTDGGQPSVSRPTPRRQGQRVRVDRADESGSASRALVGFSSSRTVRPAIHASVQTDESELESATKMARQFQTLYEDLQVAREELENARIGIQIQQEERLEASIADLYSNVNEQIGMQQRAQDSRIDTVRGSFQQQMRDALAKQAGLYKEEIRRIKQSITEHNERESAVLKRHIEEQIGLLQRKEIVIEKLKERIKHQEAELALHQVEVASLERALGDCVDVLRKSDALTRVLHALDRESAKKEDMVTELTRRVAASNRRVTVLERENDDLMRRLSELNAMHEDAVHELHTRPMPRPKSHTRNPSPTPGSDGGMGMFHGNLAASSSALGGAGLTLDAGKRRGRRGSVAVMGSSKQRHQSSGVLTAEHLRRKGSIQSAGQSSHLAGLIDMTGRRGHEV